MNELAAEDQVVEEMEDEDDFSDDVSSSSAGDQGVTPVDRIKNKLAQKRKPKPDPYGYGQGRYQGD